MVEYKDVTGLAVYLAGGGSCGARTGRREVPDPADPRVHRSAAGILQAQPETSVKSMVKKGKSFRKTRHKAN
jgi:hypothetical protein